jgi:putative Mg2+ transporter-C (MgtC) family protein
LRARGVPAAGPDGVDGTALACLHAMNAIDDFLGGVWSEFADLGELHGAGTVTARLLLAALLGGLLGYDRERKGKSAGLRTHMLVAMGSALFVMVPMLSGMTDVGRVIQGVVTGIGFLGAGTIIKHQSQEHVVGLTTAAGVWMTSAIGVACGLGRGLTAIFAALLAFAVLAILQRWFEPGSRANSAAIQPAPVSTSTGALLADDRHAPHRACHLNRRSTDEQDPIRFPLGTGRGHGLRGHRRSK